MKYSIKPIAFRPEWVTILGDIETAIFYQQILYWSDKGDREDGFIYKSISEIEHETTLTKKQQSRVVKKLVNSGYIDYKMMNGKNNKMMRHFRIILDLSDVQNGLPKDTSGVTKGHPLGLPKGTCIGYQREPLLHYTENTTENTTKSTTDIKEKIEKEKTFFEDTEQQKKISNYFFMKGYQPDLVYEEIKKFILYWTEEDRKGKQRWQDQKFFDPKRRLITWFSRVKPPNQPATRGVRI